MRKFFVCLEHCCYNACARLDSKDPGVLRCRLAGAAQELQLVSQEDCPALWFSYTWPSSSFRARRCCEGTYTYTYFTISINYGHSDGVFAPKESCLSDHIRSAHQNLALFPFYPTQLNSIQFNFKQNRLNQAKPKTDVEARIYEALSHKNWGSSSTLMNEIARDSFDYDKFNTVTRIIWESLDHPRPAAWRVVFKALTLLEHLIKNGSERCVDDGRNHSHVLRALFNFNYYEGTVDRGQGVREKSKQVVELIGDDERIREERTKAKQLREKFGGNMGGASNTGSMSGIGGGGSGYAGYGNDNSGGYSGSGGGGYGDSGIGSSGGYSDAAAATNNTNSFSGRYSEEVEASDNNAPTFAAIPPKKTKKKSKKSKKKKEKSFEESEVPAPGKILDCLLITFDFIECLPSATHTVH